MEKILYWHTLYCPCVRADLLPVSLILKWVKFLLLKLTLFFIPHPGHTLTKISPYFFHNVYSLLSCTCTRPVLLIMANATSLLSWPKNQWAHKQKMLLVFSHDFLQTFCFWSIMWRIACWPRMTTFPNFPFYRHMRVCLCVVPHK